MAGPEFQHGRSVTSISLLAYLNWVTTSRQPNSPKPLTLPPVQRSALWRPRQVLNLWRSVLDGMPVGSFYLTTPGEFRRSLGKGGNSETSRNLGHDGFDLLDGQQRTHALLLAVNSPTETGKCIWIEALRDRVELHLTTQAHPFGFDKNDERLGLDVLRQAYRGFSSDASASSIFMQSIADGQPVLPRRQGRSEPIWPLSDVVSTWISSEATALDNGDKPSRAEFHRQYGDQVSAAMSAISRADIALIYVTPPDNAVGGKWLLNLFDRIGTGGTPLSGPERLYSMYKHHVPMVHDAVTKISMDTPGLLEPVEIARTAIRIAGTLKSKPIFWDPAPLDFPDQLARGADLRLQLDGLIGTAQAGQETMLGKAFATVDRLIRYRASTVDGEWDIGLPPVLVGDLHPELLRVLVHWAVRSKGIDVEAARGDVIRFALFWHLCVTNDAKAAAQASQVLRDWAADGSFPWLNLCRRLTSADTPVSDGDEPSELLTPTDPSALRLVSPQLFRKWSEIDGPPHLLRTWQQRFEKPGDRNTAELFRRWWGRSGMLLWLQRGYLHDILPSQGQDEDRPVDLDHIQPQAAFQEHWSSQGKRLPPLKEVKDTFQSGRWLLGHSIGNFRWVPPDVNRADGDQSIIRKLRLDQDDWFIRSERRPGARDGAIDPTSCGLWRRASAAPQDRSWSAERIAAWQQAVEERAVWLYESLWDEAGYSFWRSSEAADVIAI